MKKLVSMTDYVLEQKRPIASADLHEADYYYQEYQVLENICNYANFLKQTLTLVMFIPCDENGNVLEKRDKSNSYDYYSGKWQLYQQAKSKVIFEDFELVGRNLYKDNKLFWVGFDFGDYTIEDLIISKTSEQHNLTLTDNVKI